MRIDCNRSDKFEAAFFQILADPIGKTVAYRYCTIGVPVIQDSFSICIRPEVIAKAAEFRSDFLVTLGVVNDRSNFPLGSQHPFRAQYPLYTILAVSGYFVVIEVFKTLTENLAFFSSSAPS